MGLKRLKRLVVLTMVVFTFLVYNLFTINVSATDYEFDYSRKDSLDTITLDAETLIEMLTQTNITDAEKAYLESNNSIFKYESKIPNNRISVSLNNDFLVIHALPHSYVDVNNNTITWIPYKASLNNNEYFFNLNDDVYVCNISDILETDEDIDITYKTTYKLDKNKINPLINEAYNVANHYVSNDIIAKEEAKYEALYQQYLLDEASYSQYLIDLENYDNNLVLYNKYLNDLKVYNEQKAKYDQYLSDLDKYNQELENYNNYLAMVEKYNEDIVKYNNYLIEQEKYDILYNEYLPLYEQYSKKMAYVNYGLGIMELIQTSMTSMSRDIYTAVMGDAVTQVLDRKDELYTVGVDKAPIKQAEDATYRLREYFTAYYSLTDDEAKYNYYKLNYSNIKKYLIDLTQALEKLYTGYPIVDAAIISFGKEPQYQILIAQLVLVCNCMTKGYTVNYDGTGYFDSNWKLKGRTMDQILEYDYDFVDDDELYFPLYPYQVAPIAPTPITVVQKPTMPKEVSKPVAPTVVLEPEPLVEVLKPTLPIEVSKPVMPTPYEPSNIILDLIEAYNNKLLVQRPMYDSDVDLNIETTFNKKIRNASEVTVKFYDLDGTYISSYTVDSGSYISYEDDLPVKNGDNQYSSYKFSHWAYEDGEILDLNNVTKEGFVHPVFVGDVLRKYEVSFIVDGIVYIKECEYGSMPSFDETLYKKYSGNKFYRFKSWDKPFELVTKDITYEAIFDEFNLVENNLGVSANINYGEDLISINISNLESNSVDLSNFMNEVITEDSNYKLKVYNSLFEITLSNVSVLSLKENNVKNLIVTIENPEIYEYSYRIVFTDLNDLIIEENYEVSVIFRGKFQSSKSSLYLKEDENLTQIRATIKTKQINVTGFVTNNDYIIYPLYKVVVYSNEFVEITINKTIAKYNDLIEIDVKLLGEGIYIDNLIIIDSNNKNVNYDENYTLLMPDSDIYIIVSYEFYNYVVEFVSDGNILSSRIYKYGDTVVVPSNPIKASDKKYSYTFVGWDKEITIVTESVTYNAIFESSEISFIPPSNPNKVNLVELTLGIVCATLGLTAAGLSIVLLKKYKLLFFKKRK